MAARFDLHCHTRRSDGALSAAETAEAAANAGLKLVGIADHFRTTRLSPETSLGLEDLTGYVEELRSLRARMRERVTVLAGLELTFSLVQTDFSFLSLHEPDKSPMSMFDFVLFESVNDAEDMGLGLEELLKVRPLFTTPVGLSHNDLERNFGQILQPESLVQILSQQRIFVELNPSERHAREDTSGKPAPWYRGETEWVRRFFAAARKGGLDFSVGSDAHERADEVGQVDDALDFLAERGLEEQLVITKRWGGPPV